MDAARPNRRDRPGHRHGSASSARSTAQWPPFARRGRFAIAAVMTYHTWPPANPTLVTLATYNEIENLPRLVDEIFARCAGGRHSGDRRQLARRHRPLVRRAGGRRAAAALPAPRRQAGPGHGHRSPACSTPSSTATSTCSTWTPISAITRAICRRCWPAWSAPDGTPAADVMIGSRYIPGGGDRGLAAQAAPDEPRRERLCPLDCWACRPRIAAARFAAIAPRVLEKVDFDAIRSRGYSFQEEILWHLKRLGAKFGETPIMFADRAARRRRRSTRAKPSARWRSSGAGRANWFGRGPNCGWYNRRSARPRLEGRLQFDMA